MIRRRLTLPIAAAVLFAFSAGIALARSDAPTSRPLLRIEVSAQEEDLALFVPLLEGRLVDRLGARGDLTLSRAPQADPAAWILHCTVTGLRYDVQSERTVSRDAGSSGGPVVSSVLLGTLDLEVSLSRPGSAPGDDAERMSLGARRTVGDVMDVERLRGAVVDDLLERATERIGRLLKKKLRP